MNPFEIIKWIGALLGAVFIAFSAWLISNAIFTVPNPEKPGYVIEVAEQAAPAAKTEQAAAAPAPAAPAAAAAAPAAPAAAAAAPAAPAAAAAAPAGDSGVPLIATAKIEDGEKVFKKCAICHIADASGSNRAGPNLWGVVNRPVASHAGFSYSAAMKEFAADGKVWDYEHLDKYLTSPKDLVKGNAMAFAGLKKPEDRAAVIAFLRSKADAPAPLPGQ